MIEPVISAKGTPAPRTLAPRLRRVSAALLIALGAGSATLLPLAPLPALARGAPDSFADLASQVSDAVVNISVSQAIADRRSGSPGAGPNIPRGTPFDDLFEEFFRRRGQGQGQDDNNSQRQQRRSNSLGSGFVIDPSGIVVTNNHVVGDATDVTVIFTDGTRLKAEIIGKDPKSDVAVLRVKPEKPLKAVKFGDSNKTRVGDWVMAVGNPFGLGGTVTVGILSARNRNINSGPYDDYLQTDASINRGNSGGPLFNMDGEVIGVNTAILSPSGGSVGIGFASPSNIISPLVEQLQKYGETRRGWLGVKIQSVDDDVADSLGLGKARGALVAGVDDKGPAKPAGIKAGDVIVKFDGVDVKTSADLPRIVASTTVGKDVEVTIVRGGKEQTLRVKLGRLEDGERQASLNSGRNDAVPEPRTTTQKALGMEFSSLNATNRAKFSIKDGVKGVLVMNVDPNSPAADKRIQAGDTVVEINQEAVNQPADIAAKMKLAKEQGRKSALFLVANSQGEVRFVALPVE